MLAWRHVKGDYERVAGPNLGANVVTGVGTGVEAEVGVSEPDEAVAAVDVPGGGTVAVAEVDYGAVGGTGSDQAL